MPHDRARALADRLLVLTLSLEGALKEGSLADAQSLFEARSLVIQELEQEPVIDRMQIQRVAEIDRRIEHEMLAKSRAIASELRKGNLGKVAHKAYQWKSGSPSVGTQA